MKTKLAPLFNGGKFLAYGYVTLILAAATIVQGKITLDSVRASLPKGE